MTSYYSSSWGFPPWPVPEDAQKKREKERREKRERRRDPRKEETYVGHLPQREGSLQDLLLLIVQLRSSTSLDSKWGYASQLTDKSRTKQRSRGKESRPSAA